MGDVVAAVKERPVIMTPDNVIASIEGRKRQTRRVVDLRRLKVYLYDYVTSDAPVPPFLVAAPGVHSAKIHEGGAVSVWCEGRKLLGVKPGEFDWVCPYGRPGDRLWVRERWRPEERSSDLVDGVRFAAGDDFVPIDNTALAADRWGYAYDNGRRRGQWRSPRYMPRWASRMLLEIVSVRVERLRSIRPLTDIPEEGIDPWESPGVRCGVGELVTRFRVMWDAINGRRAGCCYDDNPWVWVIAYRVLEVKRG